MPPLRFAPYREIAREVASRLAASRHGVDPLAPWPEDVIVPSRGMAMAIGGELLALLPEGVAGLQLVTIDELARRILAASGRTPRVANETERRLAMRTAIRSIDHEMMQSRGVASMLERAYRDVRDSGLTLADLGRRITNARGLRNRNRTEAIVEAWREYERLIGKLGAVDSADVLRDALRPPPSALRPPLSALRPHLLAGFYDMTGAQFAFVEALLRAERIGAIWIPSEEPFAQPFAKALAPYVEVMREPQLEIREPRLEALQYDTPLDELRDVCARIAALLADGVPAHEIGIVARSLEPYDVRLLHRFAAEHGFHTTSGDDIPLHAHRLGRGAITLLRLRERGFPRTDVLELVRDGLRIRTRIDVDEADAATRRARIAGGTSEELRAIRNRSRILDDYLALVAELEALPLENLSSLFTIETELDLQAAQKLDEIAAVFERAKAWNTGFDAAAFIDAIEHEIVGPPRPARRAGVWADELLRSRGRTFTHLFAVRMQDDVFPQRRTEDPLFPDSDRRILGLREIGDGRDEERLLFSLVTAAGSHVSFSFAAGDGFGKVLRPSRFLSGVRRHKPRVSERQLRHRTPRQLQLLAKAGTSSIFDGYVGPLQQLPESLSPTQLEDFGECPQKFLLKHILGATDIDHPERELQIHPREKGTLDHRILERFYRATSEPEIEQAAAALPKLPEPLAARLEQTIDAEFDRLERDTPPFNRTVRDIERRATKRILREFLAADLADLAAQQLVPRWFEYRFGRKHRDQADHPEPFVVEAGGVPVRVEGTIDRIDAGGGRFRIIDYKSGKAGRHQNLADKVDRGVRLQLALYAMAVAEFFGAPAEQVSATIKPLVQGDVKLEKFGFALHEKREGLLATLEIFMRAIRAGAFPAFPNENDLEFNSCKYCPVNHSCRTKHDAAERYAVAQQRDPKTLLGGPR